MWKQPGPGGHLSGAHIHNHRIERQTPLPLSHASLNTHQVLNTLQELAMDTANPAFMLIKYQWDLTIFILQDCL
jgi:hypothetical protein